jgi:RNA polymerase sigma-70 factor (ECF subfamily)
MKGVIDEIGRRSPTRRGTMANKDNRQSKIADAASQAAKSNKRNEDMKLVERIVTGDPGAFDELHGLYRDRVFAFALKRLRNASEADDICQDVFMQVFRCVASFEGRSSLLTWIFGITHHQICRRLRKRSHEMLTLEGTEALEVAADNVSADRQVDAARALASCNEVLARKVTDAQREVFHLRYTRNYTTRDIAEELGKSRQAVKISLFRTRRTLSAEMSHRGLAVSA